MAGNKRQKLFDWSSTSRAKFLLRVAYLGTNYYGFAWQPVPLDGPPLPTVERSIFAALLKLNLIEGRGECNYSRCGRTDRGVHAAGNYIALDLRLSPNPDAGYDYVKMINAKLPADIRVLSAQRVPACFDARFSCLYRVYKYFFVPAGVDLGLMREAAALFVGEHDFRNFCKMDVGQVRHFRRRIISIDIEDLEGGSACVTITGLSYLWHQIRNMMAVLFLVGEGHEKPAIISELLDVESTPQKPTFTMASESGLILWNCFFEGVFSSGDEARHAATFAGMFRDRLRDVVSR